MKCAIAALLAVAILALSSPMAFAAGGVYGSLSGTVLDSTSRAPISGATVTAKSPSNTYNSTTNGSGQFTMLGVASDTYTVTVTAAGHDLVSIPGVTVFGDQQNSIGSVALEPHLATIARVTSRSVSNAYQPTQTTDQYTINQQTILQSTGNAKSTNENAALLSVPGVTLTNNSMPYSTEVTIRGAAAWEVGYQFDGVPFREPFVNGNGSFGLMNGVGNIQVVEGGGDATQAGVGAGVINVIPQRGSGPGSGNLYFGVGGPNYDHQLSLDYGFSSPDNRISEYFSYNGERLTPYYGYANSTPQLYTNYFPTQNLKNDQILNNFFYKFGKDLTQQFQVLYLNASQQGGLNNVGIDNVYYPYDALTTAGPNGGVLFSGLNLGAGPPLVPGGAFFTPAQYAQLIGLTYGTPSTATAATTPQELFSSQTRFLKLEYDNNLSSSTYLALRYYNWELLTTNDSSHTDGLWNNGLGGNSTYQYIGGPTSGVNADLVHQFGSNLTVTLNGQYNVIRPVWNLEQPLNTIFGMTLSGLPGFLGSNGNLLTTPLADDWLPPATCASCGYVYNYFATHAVTVPAQDCSTLPITPPFASNCLPRIPMWGINYNSTTFQNWGAGLRFQWNPTSRLRFDLGFREEGQNQHWGSSAIAPVLAATGTCQLSCAQYGVGPGSTVPINNPYDVPNQFWRNNVLWPTVAEPRLSASYQMGTNDGLRFSYGRTAVFADAQFAGTPFGMTGAEPYVGIPAKGGSVCGWYTSTTFPCQSYYSQLYWQGDNVEAPDAGNSQPAIYTNYDFSYSHLFPSGWGMRLSPFFRTGSQLPIGTVINTVLGIFATTNLGYEKTTGVEFDLTTPQRPVGLSGFLAATYQNVLTTTEPFTFYENAFPIVPVASIMTGQLYRADFVSPFALRIGAVQNFKNGFSISPQLQFNVGYPYNIGNFIAAQLPTGAFTNVPVIDFGPAVTSGFSNAGSLIGTGAGAALSTNYYDPSNPGSATAPNIAATRGAAVSNASGALLSHWNLQGNMTMQYKFGRNTVGVQMFNLFGNAYIGTIPGVNPWYQPVATGLSGPSTNQTACANQIGLGNRGCFGPVPNDANAFTNGAYLLNNGNNTAGTTLGPQQPFYLQVFYQRSF
ncbi:MAG: carboxypeptidase regulatory-like domain-containing protein [Candidatus Eremiobacteraeota bacterium]|nr:carboxypeptidase regulatory-like domain-containing protein [Candidatus Eremiobacteraeota bacterium]